MGIARETDDPRRERGEIGFKTRRRIMLRIDRDEDPIQPSGVWTKLSQIFRKRRQDRRTYVGTRGVTED